MSELTKLIAEIDELAKKATPGPWAVDPDDRPGMRWNNHIVSNKQPHMTVCFMSHTGKQDNTECEANAALIVRLVNAWPQISAALRSTGAGGEIVLAEGEHYAGVVIKDDAPAHHLILLPGDAKLPWKKASEWAKKQRGELPDLQEAALLYANCKLHVEADWYWTSAQHADDSSFAWFQSFNYGLQDFDRKDYGFRCRAVRRVVIERLSAGEGK